MAKSKEAIKRQNTSYYKRNKEKIKQQTAKWRKENPEKSRASVNKNRSNNPLRIMLASAKQRARINKFEFNITSEDLLPLPIFCPALGIRLLYGKLGKKMPGSASLDRIDNDKGYIKGNVEIISDRANRIKSDASLLELENIVQYMKENLNV